MRSVTDRPSSTAAAFTGLGGVPLPRPRRLSGRVTTSAMSYPAATSARNGGTAMAGVPGKTSRRGRTGTGARVTRSREPEAALLGLGIGVVLETAPLDHGLLALVGRHPLEHQHAV